MEHGRVANHLQESDHSSGRSGRHCDISALDITTGKEVWKTARDEQPSWPTPLLYEGPQRTELVTAAPMFARSYDPDTGKELWRLGKHSALSTPTPMPGTA